MYVFFSFSYFHVLFFEGEHSWLLSEPDPGVEVSVVNTGGQADRTLLQSVVFGKTAGLNKLFSAVRLHIASQSIN